jgi:hypothetical protein
MRFNFILGALMLICQLVTPFHAYAQIIEPAENRVSSYTTELLQQIDEFIELKEQAVRKRDESLFISLLNQNNKKYVREATNWFRDAITFMDPDSFRLQILKVTPLDMTQFKVTLNQSYRKDGKRIDLIYNAILVFGEKGWVDGDVAFHQIKKGHILVKFDHFSLKTMALDGATLLERAVVYFKSKFDWEPDGFELKLYRDPELFRQSVKFSLPKWAGGWNEYGESIKWIGKEGYDSLVYHSGLVHETTHQMLGEMTNDNAAYWMHEGLATMYELEWVEKELGRKVTFRPQPLLWTANEMLYVRLEELDRTKAGIYYYQAYLMMTFMEEQYGEQAIAKWMLELKESPYIEGTTSDKMKFSNERTIRAFEIATGIPFEQFAKLWDDRFLAKE